MEISRDLSHRHLVMIRFNPDGYVCAEKDKNILSPWAYNKFGVCTIIKKWQDAWNGTLEVLSKTIDYWMKNKPDKLIEIVELYY